ncbi:ABC-F family ATP-binding cassette domain-containing protein [Caulobacter sp. S45]|uniref:ABC-F family ATP-binding cassette domain-containing protein n=1 Tax=Caulobacter sp. S45 TaxID=1641861 RepID=UPI001576A76B|nr:ABC-F family ATP-binding cassette domain-containing protein [Caulobacter sp. S45]
MLQITDLSFNAWGRRFFTDASVRVPDGAKVGLVGRNGVGKSTLFKLILGELPPLTGEIAGPRSGRIATVAQEHAATAVRLLDTVLAADVERATLLAELDTAAPERLGEIHGRLIDIGAEAAPSRAAEILSGLGFSHADLARQMAEFSGGWRMRVALASALFAEPDLLLLDEPTNYLDLEGALWLEQRLKRYPRTAVVISHDRELLNNSVDHILHIREGKLDLYAGGYDDFERMRAEKQRLAGAQAAKQDAERAKLQAFVDRFRAKATKAAQAQSRMKRLAKMQAITVSVESEAAAFTLPSPERPLSPPLVRLEKAAVGYDGRAILRNLTLRLDVDDRIGLLGVNGAGKSTFAKLLAEALTPMAGELAHQPRMRVGWFNQHQIEAMDPADTPLDMIRRALPEDTEPRRRSKLAQFGITSEKMETTAENLSGGERARLLLHLVAMQAPHLLILDEPTNHLDIDSRRALMEALNGYEGAVLLITHDRSLMELVADRLWLAADGTITPFEGDMEAYVKLVLDRAKTVSREQAGSAPPADSAKDARKASASARAQVAPLKRTMEAAEKRMDTLTGMIAKLDVALSDPALFARDPGRAVALGKARVETADQLAVAEMAWMEAAEAYEAAKAEAAV